MTLTELRRLIAKLNPVTVTNDSVTSVFEKQFGGEPELPEWNSEDQYPLLKNYLLLKAAFIILYKLNNPNDNPNGQSKALPQFLKSFFNDYENFLQIQTGEEKLTQILKLYNLLASMIIVKEGSTFLNARDGDADVFNQLLDVDLSLLHQIQDQLESITNLKDYVFIKLGKYENVQDLSDAVCRLKASGKINEVFGFIEKYTATQLNTLMKSIKITDSDSFSDELQSLVKLYNRKEPADELSRAFAVISINTQLALKLGDGKISSVQFKQIIQPHLDVIQKHPNLSDVVNQIIQMIRSFPIIGEWSIFKTEVEMIVESFQNSIKTSQ